MRRKIGEILIANGLIEKKVLDDSKTGNATWILDYVYPVADFPTAGIQFHWYNSLLREPAAFGRAIRELAKRYRGSHIEAIAGIDSTGFIFGAALAYELRVPFILVRKSGKFPENIEKISYQLEPGGTTFEIEKDSILEGQKVLVIDDVLVTGRTPAAACTLLEALGAEVLEVACLIELAALKGRERIAHPVFSLIAIEELK